MTDQEIKPEAALESWKEIAAHLKRDVRTAKRWEKSEGLPVRRHLHQARSSVYASASELDAWWAARSPLLLPAAPASFRSRLVPHVAFAAVLLLALSTVGSGQPGVVRAAAQRTGPSLTEIFTPQLAIEIDAGGRFSPDGKRLAAIDNGYLVVVDVETERRTRLTATNWGQPPYAFAGYPVWSPDGTRLAYGWFVDGHWEVRVIPAAGGPSQVLFNKGTFFPSDWSPDGQGILGWLDRPDGKASVATVSIAGEVTELRTWEKTPRSVGGAGMPMFSPDGRDIAYGKTVDDRSQMFLLNLATRAETTLTGGPVADRLPVWSGDGGTLIFLSDRSGRWDVWALPVRDGKPAGDARIVYSDIGDVRTMYGLDGQGRLVFTRQVTFGQLYSVAVDPSSGVTLGPPNRPVLQLEGKHMQAVWSPDGKRLALLAQTRERGALYITASSSGEVQELNTRGLGWMRIAGWLPSSDAVVVSATLGGDFRVYRVRLAGSGPELLYTDRQMNWSTAQLAPDGTAVVASAGDEAAATVRIIDLSRKQTIRELKLQPGEYASGFAWTPDGRAVYGALGRRVVRIPVPSGEPQEIAIAQGQGLRSLALSPDGRTLALGRIVPAGEGARGASEERYELYVVNASGGELKRVQLPAGHRPWRVHWAADGKIGYISWQAKSQFFRLSDFLPKTE